MTNDGCLIYFKAIFACVSFVVRLSLRFCQLVNVHVYGPLGNLTYFFLKNETRLPHVIYLVTLYLTLSHSSSPIQI